MFFTRPTSLFKSVMRPASSACDVHPLVEAIEKYPAHPASWSEVQLLAQCKLTFSRASGPGGQNRNKVETSVQIEYLPAGIIAAASECRTQNENRKIAVQRLRCKLAVELRPDLATIELDASSAVPAKELICSKTWQQYCRNGRIDISESNSDWPTILAEIIGLLSVCDWSIGQVATILGTTSSQLVKLLKKHSPAFVLLNRERKARSQRPLE